MDCGTRTNYRYWEGNPFRNVLHGIQRAHVMVSSGQDPGTEVCEQGTQLTTSRGSTET